MTEKSNSLPGTDSWPLSTMFSQSPVRLFRVPKYQRGYSWTDKHVLKLLEDLDASFKDKPDDYYLIGQMILSNEKGTNWFDIVDGQQRITTLYLFFIICQQKIGMGDGLDKNKKKLFGTVSLVTEHLIDGKDFEPRFIPAESLKKQMKLIVQGQPTDEPTNNSEENLETAYNEIEKFLDGYSENELFDFLWYVLNKVVVLALTLPDNSQAIQVFGKINNRGLTLDDADLLKNLLFEKVESDDDFEKLSENWEKATENLFSSKLKRVKSMEFLMKALIGIETGKSIRSDDVYTSWRDILVTESKAKDFAHKLPAEAKALAFISNGRLPTGHATELTYGSHFFKWVQHLEVLLAGRHLSEESYLELAKIVEARVMLSLFSAEKNQKLESILHVWSERIGKLNQHASREDILKASENVLKISDIKERIGDLETQLSLLTYSKRNQQVKIRYVLSRCAMAIEFKYADEHARNDNSLRKFMLTSKGVNTGYDLDHIFPQSLSRRGDWIGTDKAADSETVINSLGNLVLLHPDDNRMQNDVLPSDNDKKRNFSSSGLIANRMLLTKDEMGPLPKRIDEVVTHFQSDYPMSLSKWGEEEVNLRQKLCFNLFKEALLEDLGISNL
jgi:hypothetical protein